MASRTSVILVSCLWQEYNHWRGDHEHKLISSLNKFLFLARPYTDIMWCNDHIEEIHDGHNVQPEDYKFYDTEQIINNWKDIYVCGYHGNRCCATKGWGTLTIGMQGIRTKLIQDLTVWWDHPPTETDLSISVKYADLVKSDSVLSSIC